MKLGKAHLVGSLVMTACAIVYTVWSLSPAPARLSVDPAGAMPAGASMPRGAGGPAPVDPMQIPPLPDVAFDRLPEWPRNPFTAAHRPQPAPPVVEAVAAPPPVDQDPEVVVSAVLYSDSRRVAVVNGRRTRVGDRVGDEVVVDILRNGVVLESARRGRRTVERRAFGAGGTQRGVAN